MDRQIAIDCLSRRGFLALAGAGIVGCATGEVARRGASRRRPNVVLILSDDQGYADAGCYGCTDVPTPGIDSLARDGVRFTDGYVTCPVCSPTRAGLLTGRYQQRFGWEVNPPGPTQLEPGVGMSLDERTLADCLREAGYATGLVGKWHLGGSAPYRPTRRGFDEFFGFLEGSNHYVPERPRDIYRNDTVVEEPEYLTDAFTREAVSFIRRQADRPFLLYLAYNAVHAPLQAPPNYLDRFAGIADPQRRTYAAMLSAMDDGIAAVRAALRETGVERDTLIFFLSDNGGAAVNASINRPLRAHKGTMYEGGIRVPFIVCGPGMAPGGRVSPVPVISLDVLPTAVAAAGEQLPEGRDIDGESLLPLLRGETADAPHETLFWRMRDAYACRRGKWKLVKARGEQAQLFDLEADLGETRDLAAQQPEILAELQAAVREWEKQLMPASGRARSRRAARRQRPDRTPPVRGSSAGS